MFWQRLSQYFNYSELFLGLLQVNTRQVILPAFQQRQRPNIHKLFMPVAMPSKPIGAEIILPNSLLCATWIVMFYYLHRHDCYQKHVLLWISIPLLWGLSVHVDPVNLIFRYLFWGTNAGLVTSALVHRYFKLSADPVAQECTAGMEEKSEQGGPA